MKVLLVDDVAVNRRILRILLERGGHQCAEAADADEATAEFARGGIGCALVDLHMPGKDGVECAREIRALPGGGAARLAIISGDAVDGAMATGLFDAAFVKPVAWADLKVFLEGARR